MDAAFIKLNLYQMCIYFMGFGSLGGRYNQWLYSFGSLVNTISYGTSYMTGARSLLVLLNNVKPSGKCEFCDHVQKMKAEPFHEAFLNTEMCKLSREIIQSRQGRQFCPKYSQVNIRDVCCACRPYYGNK